jgi:hypothetical protein
MTTPQSLRILIPQKKVSFSDIRGGQLEEVLIFQKYESPVAELKDKNSTLEKKPVLVFHQVAAPLSKADALIADLSVRKPQSCIFHLPMADIYEKYGLVS